METLPAVSSSYGTITVTGAPYQYNQGAWANLTNVSIRTGYSKNPIVRLDGITPWRYPSNYRRYTRIFSDVLASYTTNGVPGYQIPGADINGLTLMSDWPGQWSNTAIGFDSNILNEAHTEALLRIADGKAQLGNMLAESKKTFHHLLDTSVQLLTAYRAARRGEWTKVQKALGLGFKDVLAGSSPANRWLEYQYGWKPLMSDIHSLYGILGGNLKSGAPLVYGRGSGHRSQSTSSTQTDASTKIYSKEFKFEQKVVCKIHAKFDASKWRTASQVGLLNPLAIGWELVPFSFVLDWFMPVGNVLEAMTARAGLSFVSGADSWRSFGSCKIQNISTSGSLTKRGKATLKLCDFSRSALGNWPSPLPYAAESPFSTTRSLNALALWRSTVSHYN